MHLLVHTRTHTLTPLPLLPACLLQARRRAAAPPPPSASAPSSTSSSSSSSSSSQLSEADLQELLAENAKLKQLLATYKDRLTPEQVRWHVVTCVQCVLRFAGKMAFKHVSLKWRVCSCRQPAPTDYTNACTLRTMLLLLLPQVEKLSKQYEEISALAAAAGLQLEPLLEDPAPAAKGPQPKAIEVNEGDRKVSSMCVRV
jgi:hypothetical protein